MQFQGAETVMIDSINKVSKAYDEKRMELNSQPDSYLKGYIKAYEGGNIFCRFLNDFTLRDNQVRYCVARQLLEERELRTMDDETLKSIVDPLLGLFAGVRKIDRRNKAREILEERAN